MKTARELIDLCENLVEEHFSVDLSDGELLLIKHYLNQPMNLKPHQNEDKIWMDQARISLEDKIQNIFVGKFDRMHNKD